MMAGLVESGAIRLPPLQVENTASSADQHWDLGFAGLVGYIFVQYTRLPVIYPVLAPFQLGKITLLTAVLGVLAARPASVGKGNFFLKASIVLLGVTTAMSALAAYYTADVSAALLNMPEQLLVAFLVARYVTNRWRARQFVFLLCLLNLKVAQHGLRYYFAEHGRAVNEMAFVRFGVIGGGGGFYDNAADLGVAMCVVFGLSVALFQAELGRRMRWFYIVCLGAFGALIIVCGSRGAIVGGAAVMMAALINSPKKKWAPVFLLLFVAGIIFLMPHASRDRFESAADWQGDDTARHRVLLWRAGLSMWADYPILGVGPENFRYVRFAHYRLPRSLTRSPAVCLSQHVHSDSRRTWHGGCPLDFRRPGIVFRAEPFRATPLKRQRCGASLL